MSPQTACLDVHAKDLSQPNLSVVDDDAGGKNETQAEAESSNRQNSQQDVKKSSNDKAGSKQQGKAKARVKTQGSEKSQKPGKGKKKGKNRDIEDLKSKLPPGMKTFDMSDFQDMDVESLKAKLDALGLDKQGTRYAPSVPHILCSDSHRQLGMATVSHTECQGITSLHSISHHCR